MKEAVDTFKELIVPLVLAMFGGCAGYILKSGEKRDIKQFLADMVISAFTGVVAFFILDNYQELSDSWKAAIIATSGCVSRELILIINRRFLRLASDKIGAGQQEEDGKG